MLTSFIVLANSFLLASSEEELGAIKRTPETLICERVIKKKTTFISIKTWFVKEWWLFPQILIGWESCPPSMCSFQKLYLDQRGLSNLKIIACHLYRNLFIASICTQLVCLYASHPLNMKYHRDYPHHNTYL